MSFNQQKEISCGVLSGQLKSKYRTTQTMLGEGYTPMNGLDIFIDFNTLIKSMSNYQKYMTQMPFMENVEKDILSTILSTYLHWKNFTRRWDNVRIFGIVNDFEMEGLNESSYLKSYLIPYVNKFHQDRFKQLVYYWNEAVKLTETILKYVPGMYFIKCNRFDSYMIPHVIDDYVTNKRDRIIISGDSLMTNYQFYDNTKISYSRYAGKSIAHLSDPMMIVQSMTKINEDIMCEFVKNKVCFNMLNTIVGDFDRGIVGLPQASITSVAYSLLRCMEKREIPTDPKSIESILPAIDKTYHDYIKKSYKLVDIEQHSELVQKSSIEKVKSQMIDLYDIDSLASITINDLNLLELL